MAIVQVFSNLAETFIITLYIIWIQNWSVTWSNTDDVIILLGHKLHKLKNKNYFFCQIILISLFDCITTYPTWFHAKIISPRDLLLLTSSNDVITLTDHCFPIKSMFLVKYLEILPNYTDRVCYELKFLPQRDPIMMTYSIGFVIRLTYRW